MRARTSSPFATRRLRATPCNACVQFPRAWLLRRTRRCRAPRTPSRVGDAAPAFALPTADGEPVVARRACAASVVYVDFWASWCGPCQRSFPWMNEMQQTVRRRRASASSRSTSTSARRTPSASSRDVPAQFTVVYDAAGATPAAYDVKGMPSSYLIDRNGVVVAVEQGFRDERRAGARGAHPRAARRRAEGRRCDAPPSFASCSPRAAPAARRSRRRSRGRRAISRGRRCSSTPTRSRRRHAAHLHEQGRCGRRRTASAEAAVAATEGARQTQPRTGSPHPGAARARVRRARCSPRRSRCPACCPRRASRRPRRTRASSRCATSTTATGSRAPTG